MLARPYPRKYRWASYSQSLWETALTVRQTRDRQEKEYTNTETVNTEHIFSVNITLSWK